MDAVGDTSAFIGLVTAVLALVAALFGVFGLTQFRKKSPGAIRWIKQTLEGRRFIPARLTRAVVSILEQLASALRVLVDARELAVTVGWSAMGGIMCHPGRCNGSAGPGSNQSSRAVQGQRWPGIQFATDRLIS